MKTAVHKSDQPIFYVYEHWRPDSDQCFLVGKGHGRRAWSFSKRNRHHKYIVAHLRERGIEPEVRIAFQGLTESEALALEIVWIAFWRGQGGASCNFTDGGEGTCGMKHSDETKAKLRALVIGTKRGSPSQETRANISAALIGKRLGVPNPKQAEKMRGRKHSEEHKAKISEGGKGRIDPPEVRERRAASLRGRKASEVTILRLRMSHLGKTQSEETKRKRSATLIRTNADPAVKARRVVAQQARRQREKATG